MNNAVWEVLIGVVAAPHGLKGDVRIHPYTDTPERMTELKQFGLERDGTVTVYTVEKARLSGRFVLVKFAGIETIDDAETLRGMRVMAEPSWLVELGEDEYYYHQLIGLQVVTTTGEALGAITNIWPTGANDVYETPLALIPAVKDIIRDIDLTQGRILVEARPGLKKSDPGD